MPEQSDTGMIDKNKAQGMLQSLVGIFENNGWLDQTLRIRHRGRRYRIFCSRQKFLAYRINDKGHVQYGYPGWPVCIITTDRIIDDSHMSPFPSNEPGSHEWLRCINDGDFELI